MSNRSLFLKTGFISAPLQNGLGRFIPQVQRVTLKFCKTHGSSKGIREFIEDKLVDFAKANPSVVVYVKPRRHRSPVMVAEFLNGDRKWMSFHNKTCDEISKWLNLLTLQAGDNEEFRYRKHWHTDVPSIQGPWTPFLHKLPEVNVAELPDTKFGEMLDKPKTATEHLIELAREQGCLAPAVDQWTKKKQNDE